MDRPATVFDELVEELRCAFVNRPRNAQVELGASDIADPCDRALLMRCAGMSEPGDVRGDVNLQAEVGSFVHTGLQEIVDASELNGGPDGRRFLTETTLLLGSIGGRPLRGTTDLFDMHTHGLIDWKTKSKSQMLEHRRHGLGVKHATQVQTYGLGWLALGIPVVWVACVFIPRDGQFGDCFMKAEPFDPAVGLAAIARADAAMRIVDAIGLDAALEASGNPTCGDRWCRFCPSPRAFRPADPPDPSADPLAG